MEQNGTGHIFDGTKNINETKLGQNAAFIFAVCAYLQIKPDYPEYLAAAQKVAEGILTMIDSETAQTVHVLNYPTLEVKEKFRVIYYDGEAALALLRLYQIDKILNGLKQSKPCLDGLFISNIGNIMIIGSVIVRMN